MFLLWMEDTGLTIFHSIVHNFERTRFSEMMFEILKTWQLLCIYLFCIVDIWSLTIWLMKEEFKHYSIEAVKRMLRFKCALFCRWLSYLIYSNYKVEKLERPAYRQLNLCCYYCLSPLRPFCIKHIIANAISLAWVFIFNCVASLCNWGMWIKTRNANKGETPFFSWLMFSFIATIFMLHSLWRFVWWGFWFNFPTFVVLNLLLSAYLARELFKYSG